jgi:apolipoprotein N-acyltransferase
MMSRVRAVESRRWMLRDTNNGYTVSVDPYGRIVAEMATDVRGELDAPYDFRSDRTLYSLWGDWIAWLSLIASILILARSITMKRALSEASDPPAVRTKSKERHRRR